MKKRNSSRQTHEFGTDKPAGSVTVSLGGAAGIDPSVTDAELAAELTRRLQLRSDTPLQGKTAKVVGMLSADLPPITNVLANRLSLTKMASLLRQMRRHPEFSAERLRGASIADLGCGGANPLGCLMVALMAGASRGVAVDPEPPEDIGRAARTMFRCAATMLADPSLVVEDFPLSREEVSRNLEGFDLRKLSEGDWTGIDQQRLVYHNGMLDDADTSDQLFDVVFSNALLEHIPDVDAILADFARLTPTGGMGIHIIDGTDHRHYGQPDIHPLDFLSIDSDEPLVYSSNRLRPTQYAERFERAGFEVLKIASNSRVEIDDSVRARLLPPYRDMPDEDLAMTCATLYVTKR